MEFKCNLLCFLNLYTAIETRYTPNIKTCSVYHWNQNWNKVENQCSLLRSRHLFICLFIFDYKALLVCVTGKTYLPIEIQAYFFNIFGSIFGALFCLLTKMLIFWSKIIWKCMRKIFECSLNCECTFPHMDKEEFFLENGTLI